MPEPEQTETQTTTLETTNLETAKHVPEALRSEAYFKTFEGKPIGEVLKSGFEAHKLVGGSVRIPGVDAKPEEWDAFYAKTRPAKVEDYKSPFKPEFAARHASENFVKGVFKAAHEVGLNQRQVDHVLKAYEVEKSAQDVNNKLELETLSTKSLEGLKTKYGENFDKAKNMVTRAAKRFGGEAFGKLIQEYNLSADPTFFEAFYNIAGLITEDSWIGGENKPAVAMTKAEAKDMKQSIFNDPKHPYFNSQASTHKGAQAEMDRLNKIIYAKD